MSPSAMLSVLARRLAAGALAAALLVPVSVADTSSAGSALRERQAAMAPKLQGNAFGQPLVLESSETGEIAAGDVYAILPHDYSTVEAALKQPGQWCDVLILHLNVKHCAAAANGITLYVGRKYEQPLDQAYRLELDYKTRSEAPDYLQVQMRAGSGPVGTRNYGFELEATALARGQSFVHFRYSVGYGMLGRMLMEGYLGTIGSGKIGFSQVPSDSGKGTEWVKGPRGAVERNAMRYYLAIAAYLDSMAAPEAERTERRLQAWFAATERYPKQLHEIDRDEYMTMKHHELDAKRAR